MQDIILEGTAFIKSFIPVKTEIIAGTGGIIIGTILNHFVGMWDNLLEAIIILMILDFITGIIASWIMPDKKLDSDIGAKGIGKKVGILCIISLCHILDMVLSQDIIRDTIIYFYIGNEGLSILENVSNCGVPVPNKIKENLAQFTLEKQQRK